MNHLLGLAEFNLWVSLKAMETPTPCIPPKRVFRLSADGMDVRINRGYLVKMDMGACSLNVDMNLVHVGFAHTQAIHNRSEKRGQKVVLTVEEVQSDGSFRPIFTRTVYGPTSVSSIIHRPPSHSRYLGSAGSMGSRTLPAPNERAGRVKGI